VTLGLGLFGVLWAITNLATSALSASIVAYLVGGLVLLVAFVLVERSRTAPMVDLSLFRIPTMSPALFASLFQGLANYAVLFLVIMYLQGVRQLTPLHASLLLVPGYLVGGIVGPFSGRLADRIGPVWPATVGLGVEIVALAMYAQLGVSTALWVVVAASVVNGIGGGGFFPANNAAVMKAAPGNAFGTASGMLRTFSNVGMVFSFSVAVLVAARAVPRSVAFAIFVGTTRLDHHLAGAFSNGIHAAFYALMAFMGVAAVLSATNVLRRHRLSGPPPDQRVAAGDRLPGKGQAAPAGAAAPTGSAVSTAAGMPAPTVRPADGV
jgi:MFS family permease